MQLKKSKTFKQIRGRGAGGANLGKVRKVLQKSMYSNYKRKISETGHQVVISKGVKISLAGFGKKRPKNYFVKSPKNINQSPFAKGKVIFIVF